MRVIDLTGMRFGRLLAIRPGERKGSHRTWVCVCDCGNETINQTCNLRSGHVLSCGCLRNEAISRNRPKNATHGMSRSSPTYKVWISMKSRCYDPGNAAYERYAARGTKVCGRWINSFENFLADMGERPLAGLQLVMNIEAFRAHCRLLAALRTEPAEHLRRHLESEALRFRPKLGAAEFDALIGEIREMCGMKVAA